MITFQLMPLRLEAWKNQELQLLRQQKDLKTEMRRI